MINRLMQISSVNDFAKYSRHMNVQREDNDFSADALPPLPLCHLPLALVPISIFVIVSG